jgi:predicted acyltransferase
MSARIESVDVLRGFTIVAMILVNTPGTWEHVYSPLRHAEWHGLTPTDLIFPFFLYIVGISIHFAYKNKTTNKFTYKKIIIRSLKLIGLGLFLNLFSPYFPFFTELETFRIPGILQRIGIVFLCSATLYLNFNWRVLVGIVIIILIGYWLLLGFVAFKDGTFPTFDRSLYNWANYVDSSILGKHMWQADYDPEGILSTIPSIASCLIGILVGMLLDQLKFIRQIVLIAIILVLTGYFINIWFPHNKAIWSSSFVLTTSGWATLILASMYYIKDVKKIKFGTIFKYVGMNAITIYFLSSIISKSMYLIKIGNDKNVHAYLYESLFLQSFLTDKQSSLFYALVVVMFYIGVGYVLYKNKIFIKV